MREKNYGEIAEKITGKKALQKWTLLMQGVGEIDQVPHKHFLEEELLLNLRSEEHTSELQSH